MQVTPRVPANAAMAAPAVAWAVDAEADQEPRGFEPLAGHLQQFSKATARGREKRPGRVLS